MPSAIIQKPISFFLDEGFFCKSVGEGRIVLGICPHRRGVPQLPWATGNTPPYRTPASQASGQCRPWHRGGAGHHTRGTTILLLHYPPTPNSPYTHQANTKQANSLLQIINCGVITGGNPHTLLLFSVVSSNLRTALLQAVIPLNNPLRCLKKTPFCYNSCSID